MSKPRHGLRSEAHNAIDVEAYYARVYANIQLDRPHTVADVGTGGGRDIVRLRDVLNGQGHFIGIDSDAVRARDAAKNFPGVFGFTDNEADLAEIFEIGRIAYLQKDIRDVAWPEALPKPKFVLCNAVSMFVPKDELLPYAQGLVGIMGPAAKMTHRHSMERPEAYPAGYHLHEALELKKVFLEAGAKQVNTQLKLQDPAGRGFAWHDMDVRL